MEVVCDVDHEAFVLCDGWCESMEDVCECRKGLGADVFPCQMLLAHVHSFLAPGAARSMHTKTA